MAGCAALAVGYQHSVGLSHLQQCKDPVACVMTQKALSPGEHTKGAALLRGSESPGFSQRLLGQVFIGPFDFQILLPLSSHQA